MKNKILLSVAGFFIFLILGLKMISTYSLWDDEANTALFAQTVHQTGDTSALFHENVIAYRNGAELNHEQKARYVSPLQYFYLAPFIHEQSKESARWPFFALTLIAYVWILFRFIRQNLKTELIAGWIFLSIGMISFLLFGIQSRYYALTLLLSVIGIDFYWFKNLTTSKNLLGLGVVTSLLFISNYLMGVAFIAALMVHALVFRRSEVKQCLRKFYLFLIPHALISLPVLLIWNPIGKHVVSQQNTLIDRANLIFRNFRDFNGGMFGSLLLLVLGLIVLKDARAKSRFKQYGLLMLAYIAAISLFSPQPIKGTVLADIRYLYPLMLLSLVWTLDFWNTFSQKRSIYWAGLAFFGLCALPYNGKPSVPFVQMIQEINHPADDPYQITGGWLREHAAIHSTVLSSLDYATYPLMWIAPDLNYVGQFDREKNNLSPDYVVSFCDDGVLNQVKQPEQYHVVAQFTSACREAYRPELFFRSFGKNNGSGVLKIFGKNKLGASLTE